MDNRRGNGREDRLGDDRGDHGDRESIAAPRNGFDGHEVTESGFQRPAKEGHDLGDTTLFDVGIGPHALKDFLLGYNSAVPLDQADQKLDRLGGESNNICIEPHNPTDRIESVWSEAIVQDRFDDSKVAFGSCCRRSCEPRRITAGRG